MINNDYWYHLSRNCFLRTIGLVINIATINPQIVKASCTLLKFSLRTSKVPDGAIRVKSMSRPYANIRDVDSKRAGEVIIF